MNDQNERDDNRELTDKRERNIRAGQSIRIAVLLIVGGLLVIWALVNRDDTRVDWIFTETTSPLILVMGAAALLGFVFGYFVARSGRDD